MSEEKRKSVDKKGAISRREFLKDAGLVAGGIGSAAILSACTPVTSTVTSTLTGAATTKTVTSTNTVTSTVSGSGATVTVTQPGTTVTQPGTTVTQPGTTVTTTGSGTLTMLQPEVAMKTIERYPLIPRLSTLAGKTIWFVNENWGDNASPQIFFEEMQKWFAKNYPTTTLVYKIKKGSFSSDDPDLWKLAAAGADAVIFGLAG
jgi:hypothetical protein